MTTSGNSTETYKLSFLEEFILELLNEDSGYFYQVPGWNLNCAITGAALADLSLRFRIDTDQDSLFVVNDEETGMPILDPILKEIAGAPVQRNTRYWIERLAPNAEAIIDQVLERLTERGILEYHDGEFWTLTPNARRTRVSGMPQHGVGEELVNSRVSRIIFEDETPDPKDAIIVSLANTCGVLPLIYQLDKAAEERIEFICNVDLIGRSIADAVSENIVGPLLRQPVFTKRIPVVSLRKMLGSRQFRTGNMPAAFAELAEEYGPVYELRPPFSEPMVVLASVETNSWTQRRSRLHLRSRDYFADFERVYGAAGVMSSLDGADHFRLRKSMSAAFSRGRLADQIDDLYGLVRKHMAAEWKVGEIYPAVSMSRHMINGQVSPLFVGVETQDIIDDLLKFKERALMVHIMKVMPEFMLKTPGMKRREKLIDTLLERIQRVHTPAQRVDKHRNVVDDYLSLYASDPQFVPETTLRFSFAAALVASAYLGDTYSFTLYAMASQPELYARIQAEADALFDNGDPDASDLTPSTIDVTHRFMMECLRMYPVVPMSIRNVMNACVVEGYELRVGTRVLIAQTAPHYMEEAFPDPFKFDIDRYEAPRNEHFSPGYAPYGLGTHMCLGTRWMQLQLVVNVLMAAHYFNIEVYPPNYKFRINPIPSQKPDKKLKFRIAEQRRSLDI